MFILARSIGTADTFKIEVHGTSWYSIMQFSGFRESVSRKLVYLWADEFLCFRTFVCKKRNFKSNSLFDVILEDDHDDNSLCMKRGEKLSQAE